MTGPSAPPPHPSWPSWSSGSYSYAITNSPSLTTIIISAAILGLIIHLLIWLFPGHHLNPKLRNTLLWLMPASLVSALSPFLNLSSYSTTHDDSTDSRNRFGSSPSTSILQNVLSLRGGSRDPKSTASSAAPPGLGNWDNSCYQNSVLQSLASITSLRDFFSRLDSAGISASEDSTVAALRQVLEDLNGEDNRGRRIWTPKKLKSMSSWQQQDAQEYLSKIMDEVERDVLAGWKIRKASGGSKASLVVEEEAKAGSSVTECQTANPLDGLLAQRVGCTRCGYVEGLSLIPFNCLTVPIGRNWNYGLSSCLDEYTNLEVIEGVECGKCTLLQARHCLRQQHEDLISASKDEEEEEKEAGDDSLEEQLARLHGEVKARLKAVSEALQDEDFSDTRLKEKCKITSKQKVSSNKTRQAMIMRTPKCLVLHINRSLFDETTGTQLKNYADVSYSGALNISPWCVGKQMKLQVGAEDVTPTEEWEMDPKKSMASSSEYLNSNATPNQQYRLTATITHLGRHENGHYVCYRKLPPSTNPTSSLAGEAKEGPDGDEAPPKDHEQWWRLSDEDVSAVSEEEALSQGGVFMLFYERVELEPSSAVASRPGVLAEVMALREATQAGVEQEAEVADAVTINSHEGSIQPVGADNDEESATTKVILDGIAKDALELQSDEKDSRVTDVGDIAVASQLDPAEPPMKENLEPMEPPSKENVKPDLPARRATGLPSPQDQSTRDDTADEAKSKPLGLSAPQGKKQVSPTTMRTAGMRTQSSEEMDPWRKTPMMATT